MFDKIQVYIDYLTARGYAAGTCVYTKQHLHQLCKYLLEEDITGFKDITREKAYKYLEYLKQNCRNAALQHRLSAVNTFFKYLEREQLILSNPFAQLISFKRRRDKRIPKDIPSAEAMNKLLDNIPDDTSMGPRDKAILELLYAAGLRKQELINLNTNDIDLGNRTLRINHGKGAKDRVVPLTQVAVKWLTRYLKACRPKYASMASKADDLSAIFLNHFGERLNRSNVDSIFVKIRKISGLKKIYAHLIRHTCATHLIQNGCNVVHVQQLLGHAQLSTTQIYTHLTINDLRETLIKHHPRNRLKID